MQNFLLICSNAHLEETLLLQLVIVLVLGPPVENATNQQGLWTYKSCHVTPESIE
jgi:hypothetical protein